jgi:hypothetical protein
MSTRFVVTCTIAALALCAASTAGAQSQEKRADNLDLTMKLLPEHAKGPEEITKRIELPRPAGTGERKDDRPDGDQNGSHKDDKGPPSDPGEQGRSTAEQARERGREFGQDVAEQARENREIAGHGAGSGNGNGGNNGGGKGPPASPPRTSR